MLTAIHPFSEEEIMAYLDGELPAERAVAAAQHLEQCRECQSIASDLRSLSQTFANWSVEPSGYALPRIEPPKRSQPDAAVWKRTLLWSVAAAAIVLVFVLPGMLLRQKEAAGPASRVMYDTIREGQGRISGNTFAEQEVRAAIARAVPETGGAATPAVPAARTPLPAGPLIIRTAQLGVVSDHFDRSRAEIEQITRAHQGYIGQLELLAPAGSGRSLNATLRVPASQLDALLEELKRLGRVSSESQRGEDVTQRYVDVDARLSNLRRTEERLLQIMRERTGKLADVLQVEEAIDRTRGDIETTEAEQKMLSGQIALATVQLNLAELYESKLQAADPSALIRLRNAAIQGVRDAGEWLVAVLSFFLAAGPSLLILALIGFFPLRWWLRKRRVAT